MASYYGFKGFLMLMRVPAMIDVWLSVMDSKGGFPSDYIVTGTFTPAPYILSKLSKTMFMTSDGTSSLENFRRPA